MHLVKVVCVRGRPLNTRGGAYPGCSSQPSRRGSFFSGPHHVHAFYRSPSPPPTPTQAAGDLQGSEVRGREERQAFSLSFSQDLKGKCLCARKCQERTDWREKKIICVYRDGCTSINILKCRDCILFKCSLTLLSPRNRIGQPGFFFSFFFCSMWRMRCKRRCLWEGRWTGCWVGKQGERSLGGLTLWYGALKRPLEGVQYQAQD